MIGTDGIKVLSTELIKLKNLTNLTLSFWYYFIKNIYHKIKLFLINNLIFFYYLQQK